MSEHTTRRRRLVACTAISAAALIGSTVGMARAEGVDRGHLEAQGWTCVPFPPANRASCFAPGLGRPFPGNPDPRPTYEFLAFDLTSGDFIGKGHLVRDDLFQGQRCTTATPYVFRALIRYWECVRSIGSP